jgi:hypothetical protein
MQPYDLVQALPLTPSPTTLSPCFTQDSYAVSEQAKDLPAILPGTASPFMKSYSSVGASDHDYYYYFKNNSTD